MAHVKVKAKMVGFPKLGQVGRAPRSLMLRAWMAAAVLGLALPAMATPAPAERAASAKRAPVRAPAITRLNAPVVTVSAPAPGQEGYIHWFLITGPDNEPETQVGIELADGRIAWSFPSAGVEIAPFIASGRLMAGGKPYEVQHLYGIKPFPDERAMTALRRTLGSRVQRWLDQRTPYCDEETAGDGRCVSCLGFVLRVLYPGSSPAYPVLPSDFRSARRDLYSTEDYLLYLAGVRPDRSRAAKMKRIDTLAIPDALREDLVRIAETEAAPAPAEARPRLAARTTAQVKRRGRS